MASKLRVGLIVDGDHVSEYVRDLLRGAQASPHVEITHAILQRTPRLAAASATRNPIVKLGRAIRRDGIAKTLRVMAWELLVRIERRRLNGHGDYRGLDARYGLAPFGLAEIAVDVDVSKSGLVYRYPAEAIAAIKAADIDVLIRCGSGILRGEILEACRFGILSFHHGDSDVNRGGPAGFWEVYQKEDVTGFTIQRLTEELDGGDILFAGRIATRHFFALNRARLYRKATIFMLRLLETLARDGAAPMPLPAKPYYERLFRMPTVGQTLRYAGRTYVLGGLKRVRRLLFERRRKWRIAWVRAAAWNKAVLHRAKVIENPSPGFLADPFVCRHEGRLCLFAEDYDPAVRRAHISAFEFDGKNFAPLGPVLKEPFHLSFPSIFEHQGRIYMCPETDGARQIRIYECVEFPIRWQLRSIAMEGVSAVDSLIFEHDGHWWLLTNIDSAAVKDRSELHAFRAADPLSGEWEPHPHNPVVFDARFARNGGITRDGDAIFRVCQRYRFAVYGSSMTVRKITRLDMSGYAEEHFADIEPRFMPGADATHHMHHDAGITVVDFYG